MHFIDIFIDMTDTICTQIFNALQTSTSDFTSDATSDATSNDVSVLFAELFRILKENNPNFPDFKPLEFGTEVNSTFKSLRSLLHEKIPFADNKNSQSEISLFDILECISKEHYHQNVNTDGIRCVFSGKQKPETASCDFHHESLIDHSIMAMCIAMTHAIGSTQNLVLVALTALFHDIGKPSCLALFGKNIGYPFHGEYGACIMSQFFCPNIEKFITKDEWETMCRTINVHMCSYHTTTKDDWTDLKRDIARIESKEVKDLSIPLSFADTFGKICPQSLSNTNQFIDSREQYNKDVNQPFNVDYMEKNGKKTLCFFVRGKSGGGKSYFVEELIKHLLSMGYNNTHLVVVSRDEIMASITAIRIKHKLSNSRPKGDEYKLLYEAYQKFKLGKLVNDEIRHRISSAISEGKIVIVDSCILYYDGIKMCMPTNISNAFIIAIDCVRNTVFTDEDAYKNGMEFDELCETLSNRTPLNFIVTQSMCIEKLASFTTNSKIPVDSYVPHLTFSYGFNKYFTIGFDIFVRTISPFVNHFVKSLSVDTGNMNIIEYTNHLYNEGGIVNIHSTLREQQYRSSNSHNDDRIVRMNYLEHNRRFKNKWNRQTRGTAFGNIEEDPEDEYEDGVKMMPIKFHFERGSEMVTGIQAARGVDTDAIETGDDLDKISKAISSIDHLHPIQQKTIIDLLLNRELDNMTLSFKKDGSLLGYTVYRQKKVIKFMRSFIENSGDKFAQKILQICDSIGIPFGTFSSQSTLLISPDMQDWTVHALLSIIMTDEEINTCFSGKTYMEAIEHECFKKILTDLYNLANDASKKLQFPDNSTLTISMETICKNRRSMFSHKEHTELALSYPESSCTVLSISYCNSVNLASIPHCEFSEFIHKYGFTEPCFWNVTHTNQVNEILDDLNSVIFEKMTEDEFFLKNAPQNVYDNWKHVIDKEGFVTYTGDTFDYGKIKTDCYYIAHKLRQKNIEYLIGLSNIESARKSFPLCVEVATFYSNIKENINRINDMFNTMCVDTESNLFKGLSAKAQTSFPKQTPQTRLKMIINQSDQFPKIADEIFSSIYPYNAERVDEEFVPNVVSSVKSILMGFVSNTINFENPNTNVEFANLFGVVRKSVQSLNI